MSAVVTFSVCMPHSLIGATGGSSARLASLPAANAFALPCMDDGLLTLLRLSFADSTADDRRAHSTADGDSTADDRADSTADDRRADSTDAL